ncbi:hypothetical protein HMN09_00581700 [Mycena chlorophos]|uniref:Uncharacterized protein n=1 Tax=Mycena chlorophos TaxID=658473 RepID=A0A8H6WA43_MYCCL|nr:hypothetical protein HMN09_00581700 [Mycena chlorophos]
MMTTNADRLRLAIALTALKFKPANVSCVSYVLQLQKVFASSQPAAPTSDGSWKTHALSLESELAALRLKYDAERISEAQCFFPSMFICNVWPERIPAAALPPTESPPNNGQSAKKKPKKKGIAETRPSLESVLSTISSIPDSDSLFSSLSSFQQIAIALTPAEATTAQRSLLLRTTQLVLGAVSSVVQPILVASELTVESQSTMLQNPSDVVFQVLSSALPILVRKTTAVSSLMNKLLDSLISSLFTPILASFVPLCNRYLGHLFPLRPTESLPVDLRPDVLRLFQSLLTPLISISSVFQHNLRGTLALIAVAHLESLFSPDRDVETNTHFGRVRSLARKDSISYLCTVLHLLFASSDDLPPPSDGPGLFETRIVDTLTRIVGRSRTWTLPLTSGVPSGSGRDAAVDEFEHGMILSVLEQFWRYSGAVQ